MKGLQVIAASVLFAAVTACTGPTEPETRTQPGVVVFFEEPMVVTAPETAQAGVPFQVSVRTYGSGCHSRGETVVEVAGVHVDVRPYDILSGRHTCNSILRMFDHAANVTVDEPGIAQVSFHGAAEPGDSMVTVVREVIVE